MNQTSPSLTGTILLLPRSLAEDVGGKVPRRRFSGIPIAAQGRSLDRICALETFPSETFDLISRC